MCKFILAWIGCCKNLAVENSKYCSDHRDLKCSSCGVQATHQCTETMMGFVCGCDLCDACEHEIAPDGTNGGNLKHIKRSEQKFKIWYSQTEREQIEGKYLMLKRRKNNIQNSQLENDKSIKYLKKKLKEVGQKINEMEVRHPFLYGLTEDKPSVIKQLLINPRGDPNHGNLGYQPDDYKKGIK